MNQEVIRPKSLFANATQLMNNLPKRTLRTLNLLIILTLLITGEADSWAGEVRSQTTPNVVLILVDDLGYMDIGANNPDCFYETPNIDRLSSTGLRFTNGYAANPVCSPTRFSLMTGRYPTRVGGHQFLFRKSERQISRGGTEQSHAVE